MKRENPAICADCGQPVEHAGAPARSDRRCEPCGEAASARVDDGDRGPVVERLRRSYHEARALVPAEQSDPIHRGQLDWIFGAKGDDTPGAAGLDARTSELVVLWLEDLIRHLEELPAGEALLSGEADAVTSRAHRAASALHTATREFADTFRRAADAEFRP